VDDPATVGGLSLGQRATVSAARSGSNLWAGLRRSSEGHGIKQVLSTPRSPWQRAYIERLIGSIRRECLDHMIVFGERSLQRALASYVSYYHSWRTRLSLGKDAPQFRRTQTSAEGKVVEIREVGGLHHHYERRAA